MTLKDVSDKKLRCKIYGAQVNLARASGPKQKAFWVAKLVELKKSVK